MDQLTQFAAADQSGGLIGALGIDVRLLVLQTIAFLILVFILGKFVYPVILKAIDERREKIEAGLGNAKKAEAELKNVEKKVADIIRAARNEASQIIDRGQQESAALSEASEARALKKAQAIIDEAHAQMVSELQAARQALRKETAELVASATEHIIKEKIDPAKDAKLIADALQEAK
ncbi:MAG TPA: F0F1 ATP synthase subunit B [Candidatus Acidoferrum sp.]|nr:F0F1 ATP synthase subunit B [Candidatus Acidoferrum sp.]